MKEDVATVKKKVWRLSDLEFVFVWDGEDHKVDYTVISRGPMNIQFTSFGRDTGGLDLKEQEV